MVFWVILKLINLIAPKFDLTDLPDPKGIPFQGIKEAKIPGRESVLYSINDFIKKSKNDSNVQVCLIKAEWGEGKTDAYDRYISEILKNEYCFPVTTSTVAKKLRKIDKETSQSSTATNFLAALFAALGDDNYSQTGEKNFFYNEKFTDPVNYVSSLLSKLFDNNDKKCYIFLDEFEEILYNDDVKADVISGIKEIINKRFGALCSGGKYSGRFHLFIACTPHAWNTITEDPNFSQVMGSTEQRLSYSMIELPLLSRSDCYYFLLDLMKVTYKGHLTKPPIAGAGVFETMINISQKNPRTLIQLFYKLMSNVEKVDENKIRCIDYMQVLKQLPNVRISIYGSTTDAIDLSNFDKLRSSLLTTKTNPEKILKIFELLSCENSPLSSEEISERLGMSSKDIPNLINQINTILNQTHTLDATFRTYLPLKENKTLDSLLPKFKLVNQGEQSYVVIDSDRVYISSIKESLTFYFLTSDEPKFTTRILFPTDANELAKILGVDTYVAQKLYSIIQNDLDASNRHYKISVGLLESLFPSPNLAKFDFIEDRSKRLELRRRAQKELGEVNKREQIHKILSDAIVDSLKFSNVQCNKSGNYFLLELSDAKKITLPTLIEAIIENITEDKINKLIDLVDKTPAILTLLFYQSHLDENIQISLERIGEIQRIPMDKILVEQLLVWKIAKNENIKINPISERSRLASLINELKIEHYLKNVWISKAEKSGIIIPVLKDLGDYGKSDIKSIIATFVSTSSLPMEKQWKFYEKLNSLKLFSAKSSFLPYDFETRDAWNSWILKLEINNFLDKSEKIVKIIDTPVEKRVLSQLKRGRNSIGNLESEFVNLSEAVEALKNYYLDTLIQKGKIQKEGERYTLTETSDPNIVRNIDNISKFVNETYSQIHDTDRFVCQTKQRDFKVISESEYIETIKELLNKLNEIADEDEKLRLLKLIISIYDYYNENFKELVSAADTKTASLYHETKRMLSDFELQIATIVVTFNKFTNESSEHISTAQLIGQIKRYFDENVQLEYQHIYIKHEIVKELKEIWHKFDKKNYKDSPFHLDNSNEKAFFFNLKYYKLHAIVEDFKNELNLLKVVADRINQYVTKINESYRRIAAITGSYVFEKEHRISYYLLNLTTQIKPPTPPSPSKITTLTQLEDYFAKVSLSLESFDSSTKKILEILVELDDYENKFNELEIKCKNRLENLISFVEGTEKSHMAKNTEITVKKLSMIKDKPKLIRDEYHQLFNQIQQPVKELTEFVTRVTKTNSTMENLIMKLNEIDKITNEIINNFIEEINSETKTIINFVNICSNSLSTSKSESLKIRRMEFEKFATKMKDRVERLR
jgi:hypothetical protein